jgi:hypothetical protein
MGMQMTQILASLIFNSKKTSRHFERSREIAEDKWLVFCDFSTLLEMTTCVIYVQ